MNKTPQQSRLQKFINQAKALRAPYTWMQIGAMLVGILRKIRETVRSMKNKIRDPCIFSRRNPQEGEGLVRTCTL